MIINHNIMALNTHRQLGMNNVAGQKSIEKLSSGFRINRAGDDAAGLAISEKMRGQIRGLSQASRNSQDAISLIQTAEGALNETHDILQRMRELAVQAASDTNVVVDRGEIQKEINQLTSELNRIGNTTEFNTMKLLDGSRAEIAQNKYMMAKTGKMDIGAAKGVTIETGAFKFVDNKVNLAAGALGSDESTVNFNDIKSAAGSSTIEMFKDADGKLNVNIVATNTAGATVTFNDKIEVNFTADSNGVLKYEYNLHNVKFTITEAEFAAAGVGAKTTIDLYTAKGANATGDIDTLNSFTWNTATPSTISAGITISDTIDKNARKLDIKLDATATNFTVTIKDENGKALQNDQIKLSAALTTSATVTYNNHGVKFTFKYNGTAAATVEIKDLLLETEYQTEDLGDQSLAFQVGANEKQSMSLGIEDMTAQALKVSSIKGGTEASTGAVYTLVTNVTNGTNNITAEYALDVSNHGNAAKAITVINDAIQSVSAERSKIGAVQNRLEHTIKNLDTSAENLQAAESRIRDVDMAKEMMEFTKNNILQQAATAMLAQANQAPQSVLQLLR
jgi:flagellin